MNRHSFIARFGLGDTKRILPVQSDSQVTTIDFVSGDKSFDYGLGMALEQLNAVGINPTEGAFDLLLLSSLVFAADTRVNRDSESQDGWTREFDLYLPVSEPDLWQAQHDLIAVMLGFLTGDRWRFIFRARPKDFRRVVPAASQKELKEFSCVSLFSGGLDSFIGAIDLLIAGQHPLLTSHYWDGMTSQHQTICFNHLERHFPENQPGHLRARVGFEKELVKNVASENTQRSRSFLFFALGTLAASGIPGKTILHVPENGLISLNVPLDSLRLGALSTRTTHPFFMARFNELLQRLNLSVELKNPYRHQTKGEMVAACHELEFLKKTAKDTMSCSAETKGRYRGEPPRHCGHCVPCLIRRAALQRGLGSDNTDYGIQNLIAQPLPADKASGRDVRSFQLLLARLQAQPRLAKFLIHKPGPLADCPDEIAAYERTFLAGIQEVGQLVKNVVTHISNEGR
jgi:hypothetical protein